MSADTAASVRRFAATIAGDVLAARQILDGALAGTDRYGSALVNLRVAVQQLQSLADDVGRGKVNVRQTADHGDLQDGQLITKPN